MPATSSCTPCCPTPQTVNIPGGPGGDGTDGTDGVDAFTLTTADFSLPAIGANVTVDVASSAWMVVGQNVVCEGPANFVVVALPTMLSATLRFLGYPGDLPATTQILLGTKIGPAGMRAPNPAYFTQTAADLTLTDYMEVIEVTANSKIMTLPTAVGRAGRSFTVKMAALGTTTIRAAGGQTIDGFTDFLIQGKGNFATVVSNGATWDVIVRNVNHYTITSVDLVADLSMDTIEITGATKTITLPAASGIVGKTYTIKLTANSTGTVAGNAAENIDAANTFSLIDQYSSVTIISNGAGWIIVSSFT